MKRNFFIGVVCAAVSCVLIYQTELVCWLLALVFLALCARCFSRAERKADTKRTYRAKNAYRRAA